MRPTLTAAAIALTLTACATDLDDPPEGEDGTGDLSEATDAKTDGTAERKAAITGMTVWIDPVARIVAADGRAHWVLDARASRNLAAVSAWVPDDAFGAAAITGKRTFTITLRDGHEQHTLLSGMPIFVTLEPVTGEPADAAIWIAPRVARASGSTRISLDPTIAPIWNGGDVIYRGGASLTSGWADLGIATPADTNPQVVMSGARTYRLDWQFAALAAVAAAPGAPVRALATRAGTTVERTAAVELRVARLGLTRRDPRAVWPNRCAATVAACLAALPTGTIDAGACGTYRQVQACGGPTAATGPSGDQLAADLRDWLAPWYAQHGADVAAAGGNSLAAAQAAVDPAGFAEVTDPAEDPYAHDLAVTRVYRHRDVVYPGSDIAWFLAYERASGAFLEAYDFN